MLLREVRSKFQPHKMKDNNEIRLKAFSLTTSQEAKAATELLFPGSNLVLEVTARLEWATVILTERNSRITMKRPQQVEVLSVVQARTASLETVFWGAHLVLHGEGPAEASLAERVPITDF